MFPTSGFFRSHNCPYYLSGLCERPYCHFRHMKQEDRSAPVRPVQQAANHIHKEQPAPTAKHSGRSRQSSSLSESEGGGGGSGGHEDVADDYTPTPLSVLRRSKVQQEAPPKPPPPPPPPSAPADLSYEPTPVTVTQQGSMPASSTSTSIARRRPLQLPAPKIGETSTLASAASGDGDSGVYDPSEGDADTEPSSSKRSRPCITSPVEASYEPTPIDDGSSGGIDQDDQDSNDDEYCPAAVAVPVVEAKQQQKADNGGGGGEIKRVFLDLFGEEPTSGVPVAPAPAPPPSNSASIGASSASTSHSGRAGTAVRRMTPSEQVARRTQQLAANPSALLSQGKVRAPSASASAVVISVAASPLAGTVANKIPDVVRQRYLDRLAEECRLVATASPDAGAAASRRAQQLELECYERSANRNVYLNAVILAIKRVRASAPDSSDQKQQQQAEEASQLSDKRLHKHLLRYAMTPAQLAENRYPPHLPPLPYPAPANPLERLCVRCGAAFLLQRPQLSTPAGQCCYHYGRAYSRRMPGAGVQQIYSCCGGDLQAKGCSLGERHVHEYNVYCDMEGYRETVVPDKATVSKKQRRAVYALDCEMIYTDAGKELARVTVINRSMAVVYDRLVRPSAPIVDCNTRFSGLREEQLASAQHQLADVQDELLKMIYSTCILIGHSLESDLQVLKLRHFNVVDTSIVFPHRQGLPKKRALRNLASDILNKIIQTGGDAGHDSSEDARTCMELMFNKLNEDLKKVKFSPG